MVKKLFVLLLSVLLGGCAFSEIHIVPPAPSAQSELNGGNGRVITVGVPLADGRQIKERCGMNKNGYNMDTAAAICRPEPNIWLANLFVDELRKAGFVVRETSATETVQTMKIDGTLLKFFVEPVIGFASGSMETDIHLKLVATRVDGLRAERNFFVKSAKTVLVGIESNFQASAEEAAKRIVKDMVSAVISLMNRYSDTATRS